MEVLFITVFFSILLAVVFIYMFINQHGRKRGKSFEQQALMPLQDDDYPDDSTKKKQP